SSYPCSIRVHPWLCCLLCALCDSVASSSAPALFLHLLVGGEDAAVALLGLELVRAGAALGEAQVQGVALDLDDADVVASAVGDDEGAVDRRRLLRPVDLVAELDGELLAVVDAVLVLVEGDGAVLDQVVVGRRAILDAGDHLPDAVQRPVAPRLGVVVRPDLLSDDQQQGQRKHNGAYPHDRPPSITGRFCVHNSDERPLPRLSGIRRGGTAPPPAGPPPPTPGAPPAT